MRFVRFNPDYRACGTSCDDDRVMRFVPDAICMIDFVCFPRVRKYSGLFPKVGWGSRSIDANSVRVDAHDFA